MAKKKTRKPSTRKGNKKKQVVDFIKQIIVTACVVIVCFIAFWIGYEFIFPQDASSIGKKLESVEKGPEKNSGYPDDLYADTETDPANTDVPVISEPETIPFSMPDEVEMPRMESDRPEEIITRESFAVSYNRTYRIPNWVAYELTAQEAGSNKSSRSNKFVPDPELDGTPDTRDYSRSGYDRGHMAPAGDMKWSHQAMKESFYTSNICPQDHYMNQGIWNDLENKCRMWAKKHKSVWVVTGPVISKKMKRIGDTGIGIPEAFFKVLMYSTGTTLEGVAFVLENRNYEDSDLKKYAMPIDEAEKLTGIDFFHQLPDAVEDKMESELHLKKWGL